MKGAIDELVRLYVSKGGYKSKDGKMTAVPLSEVDAFVTKLNPDDKLHVPGREDDLAAGLLRLPYHPRL